MLWRDTAFEFKFLNYGYAELNKPTDSITVLPEDEAERYCINLYHHNLGNFSVKDKVILEVGCGRGGGASYISRYFHPKSYIGLDLSKRTIRACNRYYKIPELSFQCGRAEALPFDPRQFDAVVNIESSRCYGDMPGFLLEVHRVLKSDGFFLFSDLRTPEGIDLLQTQFHQAQFTIVNHENITANVIYALELDNTRRINLIQRKIPKILYKTMTEFAGTLDSERYQEFKNGALEYHWYILQKSL